MHTRIRCSLATLAALLLCPGPLPAQDRELVAGQDAQGTLVRGVGPERSGRPYQVWTFRAQAGQTLQIDMRSDAFDAYLVLQDSAGRFVNADDNNGGGRNARLVFEVPATGRWRLLARSLGDSLGAYTIRVGQQTEYTEGIVGEVRRGQTLTATLAQTDPRVRGRPYQAWILEGNGGDSITIDLRSDAFDTFIIVQDQYGRTIAENDDVDGELHSRVTFALPSSGRFRVVVTAFTESAAGAYTLRVRP